MAPSIGLPIMCHFHPFTHTIRQGFKNTVFKIFVLFDSNPFTDGFSWRRVSFLV